MDSLVSTDWLAGELEAGDLRIVDATYVLAADGRDPQAEFDKAHIPYAVFFDIADVSDTASSLPTMLPSAAKFASRMQALGLGDGNRIVVYDNSPYHSAARAWWMLMLFGAHDVALLDGGLAKWQAEGRPLESGKPAVRHRHFTVWDDRSGVRDLAQMRDNLTTRAEQVVDTRSAVRFRGEEPETRPGELRSDGERCKSRTAGSVGGGDYFRRRRSAVGLPRRAGFACARTGSRPVIASFRASGTGSVK